MVTSIVMIKSYFVKVVVSPKRKREQSKEGSEIPDNSRIVKYPPCKLENGWIATEMIVRD